MILIDTAYLFLGLEMICEAHRLNPMSRVTREKLILRTEYVGLIDRTNVFGQRSLANIPINLFRCD